MAKCRVAMNLSGSSSSRKKKTDLSLQKKMVIVDGMKFTASKKKGDKFYVLTINGHKEHDGVYKYCGKVWKDYSYEDRQQTLGCPKCQSILTQAFVHNIDEPEDDEEDGCPHGCDIRGIITFYCKKCSGRNHMSPFQ